MKFIGAIAALLLLVVAAAASEGQGAVMLSIERTSPSGNATLPRFGSFYVAVRYRSDKPLRIQARAYADGKPLDAGQAMNASVLHAPPEGTALAWVRFDRATRIDEIRVTAYDNSWKPQATLTLPAQARWLAEPEKTYRAPPGWVRTLMDEEARIATQSPANSGRSLSAALGGLVIVGGLPAYLLLQVLSIARFRQGWRLAALAPAGIMSLAALHAGYALSQGSNLWPILIILGAPVACLYLAGLFGLRSLQDRLLPG
jgi:uncharacterized membrane protein